MPLNLLIVVVQGTGISRYGMASDGVLLDVGRQILNPVLDAASNPYKGYSLLRNPVFL
jgi:hypothetical protein